MHLLAVMWSRHGLQKHLWLQYDFFFMTYSLSLSSFAMNTVFEFSCLQNEISK